MTPERTENIDGTTVREFYWAGDMVVYVNNRIVNDTFDHVCATLRAVEAERLEDAAP